MSTFRLMARAFPAAALVMLAVTGGCSEAPGTPSPADMRPVTASTEEVPSGDIKAMAVRSDVRIKLRRNKDGTYSYDISGEDAQSVIEADRELETYVSKQEGMRR